MTNLKVTNIYPRISLFVQVSKLNIEFLTNSILLIVLGTFIGILSGVLIIVVFAGEINNGN